MTDWQWKKLQEELKSVQPGRENGPEDSMKFKEKVLQEYKRRSRFDSQSLWMRRVAITVTACAAVWIGLVITKPLHYDLRSGLNSFGSAGNASDVKNGPNQKAGQVLNAEDVVYQFFDLNLQKRPQEAQQYLSDHAKQNVPLISENMSNPHMTGFILQKLSQDPSAGNYRLKLNWGDYGNGAEEEVLDVSLKKYSGKWLIEDIQGRSDMKYHMTNPTRISRDTYAPNISSEVTPAVEGSTFFSIDLFNDHSLAFAVKEKQPSLYVVRDGKFPQKLATLPPGIIGEVFWANTNTLAVNFQPEATMNDDEILLYDVQTGKLLDTRWLQEDFKNNKFTDPHITHTLPGNKMRVRDGAHSVILDLNLKVLMPDPNSHDSKPLSIAKYDATVIGLPKSDLQVYAPNSTMPDLNAYGIPSNKRLDPRKETGMYVLNGSIQAYEISGDELQVEVSQNKGHVQVVAVPTEMLKAFAGKSVTITVYDEAGYLVAPSRAVEVAK